MKNIRELSRVRNLNGLWVVEVLSNKSGRWIIQGEWATEAQANKDRKNWL